MKTTQSKKLHTSALQKNKHQNGNYQDRVTYRGLIITAELIKYFKTRCDQYNFFMTLTTNRQVNDIITLERKLKHFRNDLCSKCFRAKYFIKLGESTINKDDYLVMWAFYEETKQGHPHYHIIGYIDPSKKDKLLDHKMVDHLWRKQYKGGTVDVQNITNLSGLTDYVLKNCTTARGSSGLLVV